MAWEQLSVNRPHLVYIILGGFTSLFMLCSSFIKERLYIGEATVATVCGIIFGPHAANLINPGTWGNTDQVTLEFSRIVLVVQCFAVGVELPKYYMEKHWRSVVFLLLPVMTFGWLVTSLFIWGLVPPLNWLESLTIAACVTATDPVLASSVVGKGKFAKRVPKHLRDLLSAESGSNDGMAFPFIYLALYLIQYDLKASKVSFHWICLTVLYECIFGAIYGFIIGYIGRHGIKWAEKHDLVDRESFLVFYFVLALFCAGSGSILGVDDLLVGFAAGVGFSNDGWFTHKTEESHVSNVIDLLLNLAYFVYLGTIIPWEMYNNADIGLSPWRLVVIALLVIFFRRIPIMMLLKPFIADIHTWREALFAGHFGPIGVGAIFVAILAKAELETETTTPLGSYPMTGVPNATLVALIWPIVTFLVISSIIVHGSSIAVFTLGRKINTVAMSVSFTIENDGRWPKLPTISMSKSQAKSTAASETDADDYKMPTYPPGTLPPIGHPGAFALRRQKEEDNPSRSNSKSSRYRKKKWEDGLGPGGPISQSAIGTYPHQRNLSQQNSNTNTLTPGQESPESENTDPTNIEDEKAEAPLGEIQHDLEMEEIMHHNSHPERADQHVSKAERTPSRTEIFQEGNNLIVENEDGDVLAKDVTPHRAIKDRVMTDARDGVEGGYRNLRKKLGVWRHKDEPETSATSKGKTPATKKHGMATAYQFGNTIIVEDEDGEVIKSYDLPPQKEPPNDRVRQGITRMGTWAGIPEKSKDADAKKALEPPSAEVKKNRNSRIQKPEDEEEGRKIRFTIEGAGQRMNEDDFLNCIKSLDPKARADVVAGSSAPAAMKSLASKDASTKSEGTSRLLSAQSPQVAAGIKEAMHVGSEMAKRRGADPDHQDKQRGRQGEKSDRRKLTPAPTGKASSPSSSMTSLKKVDSPSHAIEESAVERKRREDALRGVDELLPGQRTDSREDMEAPVVRSSDEETPAEKRRRLSVLGVGVSDGDELKERGRGREREGESREEEDSDDDGQERIPPRRGIRFADSPVRRGKVD